MNSRVLINGQAPTQEEFLQSFSLLLGDGVFETLLVRDGRTRSLPRHLRRLIQSATECGLVCDESEIPLDSLSEDVAGITRGWRGDGRLRISISATLGTVMALDYLEPESAEISLMKYPWPIFADDELRQYKSLSYGRNLQARRMAEKEGFTAAYFVNHRGEVAETNFANLVVECKGRFVTPPLTSGALPGIGREILLSRHKEILEEVLSESDLMNATGIALLSSLRGLRPVSKIGDRDLQFSSDFSALRDTFTEELESEEWH